jgi:hypothetical protein
MITKEDLERADEIAGNILLENPDDDIRAIAEALSEERARTLNEYSAVEKQYQRMYGEVVDAMEQAFGSLGQESDGMSSYEPLETIKALAGEKSRTLNSEAVQDCFELLETALKLWLENHPNKKFAKEGLYSGALKQILEVAGNAFDPKGYVKWALSTKETLEKFQQFKDGKNE